MINKSELNIPKDYIVYYFNQYVGYPKHRESGDIYYGGCPFCREDSSWGKKARFFYIPKKDLVFCHNCGYSKRPLNFIKEVTGMSFNEIIEEVKDYDYLPEDIGLENNINNTNIKQQVVDKLPYDSINLDDLNQIDYYKDNDYIKIALNYIKKRRLDTAVNRPENFYISLTDKIHKNRLVLPFFDEFGDLKYYQTRNLIDDDSPSYLSKFNSEKILPNLNKIDPTIPYLFIFEGPIDSYFCKNGTAVAGIQKNGDILFTKKQKEQIDKFYLFEKIWVLDSQWKDKTSFLKTKRILQMGEKVFIWPKKQGMYFKDFNEMAIKTKIDEIPYRWIKKNALDKIKGTLVLSQIENLIYR